MKKLLSLVLFLFVFTLSGFSQKKIHSWTNEQLKDPAALNADLLLPKGQQQPLIFDMGPVEVIKGAVKIGPAEEKDNIRKLKAALKDVSKDKEIVVYCGCCPFDRCPNADPAFQTLLKMGFKNAKMLNLPQNLKTDWIDKGFPLQEK